MPDPVITLLRDRKHATLVEREEQLALNILAWQGGQPYIAERLTRWPGEDDASWYGSRSSNVTIPDVIGRRDRAFLVNYAGRIIQKINQLVFSEPAEREGADEDFLLDATKTGMSINQLMTRASSMLTACGWCWLSVDRAAMGVDPSTGQPMLRSMADKEQTADRPYWSLWNPNEVEDWRFGSDGQLAWLKTAQEVYQNEDPRQEARLVKVVTLWERGLVTRYTWQEGADKEPTVDELVLSTQVVPFVCLGVPDAAPWWFDAVELTMAAMMNLMNAHAENLGSAGYPQLVIPASLVHEVMQLAGKSYTDSLELIRGVKYPMMEPDTSKGISRFITPAVFSDKAIPDEIARRVKDMFDMVGLALANPDTKQIQSADSKRLDQLDPQAALRGRAVQLEEAETKMVGISVQLDSTFPAYKPAYPKKFDMGNTREDMESLLMMQGMQLPPSGLKELLRAGIRLVGKVVEIPEDRMQTILDEIEDYDMELLQGLTGNIPGRDLPGDQDKDQGDQDQDPDQDD